MRDNLFRKSLVCGIIALFVGSSAIPTFSGTARYVISRESTLTKMGSTIYVDNDSECPGNGTLEWPYCKIQYGIDNASDGDTVYVFNGTYYENIVVNKTVDLIGEDRNSTVIDGNNFTDVVYISANFVKINGFTIQNSSSYGVGIGISSNNNTIAGNTISNNDDGISFNSGGGITTITGNTISNNYGYGIFLGFGSNNIISDNTIASNNDDGIFLANSSNNTITDNAILNNGDDGMELSNSSNNNTIYHNNLINNTQNAYNEGNNKWDNNYPSGGNYWDDYTGNDTTGDGIGETPYPIPGGDNEDRYPLIYPLGENPPFANFTCSADNLTLTFDASDSIDRDGTVLAYEWDFNDGNIGYGKIVNHSYTLPEPYNVTLTITDNDGYKDNITKLVEAEIDVETLLIFGRIKNLTIIEYLITFEAENILVLTFSPLKITPYTSGEKIITSIYNYAGVIAVKFILALCSAYLNYE